MTLGLGEYVAAMSLSRSDCFISTGFDMCSALRHGSALQFYLFMAGFDSTSRVGTLHVRCIQCTLLALLHAVGHRER